MARILIALGANVPGPWGDPLDTLRAALRHLGQAGVRVKAASRVYATLPVGSTRQPWFLNAVILAESALPLARTLALLKRLERSAGRRPSRGRGARPLDLDIVDAGGRIVGRPGRRREAGRLLLPHPEAHRRRFVLVPLLEVSPHWVHAPARTPGRRLAARLARRPGEVRPTLDSLLVP